MLAIIDDLLMYTVAFDVMPQLPVYLGDGWLQPYSEALTDAIARGKIKKPGRYKIWVDTRVYPMRYNITELEDE